jgi:hypothetical protein
MHRSLQRQIKRTLGLPDESGLPALLDAARNAVPPSCRDSPPPSPRCWKISAACWNASTRPTSNRIAISNCAPAAWN